MSYQHGPIISYPAAGDLTGKKGCGVVCTAGKWTLAGAGVIIDGVLVDVVDDTDETVPAWVVACGGRVEVQLSATVVAGERLTPASGGTFVGVTSGDESCLKADVGGATGEFITALIVPWETAA